MKIPTSRISIFLIAFLFTLTHQALAVDSCNPTDLEVFQSIGSTSWIGRHSPSSNRTVYAFVAPWCHPSRNMFRDSEHSIYGIDVRYILYDAAQKEDQNRLAFAVYKGTNEALGEVFDYSKDFRSIQIPSNQVHFLNDVQFTLATVLATKYEHQLRSWGSPIILAYISGKIAVIPGPPDWQRLSGMIGPGMSISSQNIMQEFAKRQPPVVEEINGIPKPKSKYAALYVLPDTRSVLGLCLTQSMSGAFQAVGITTVNGTKWIVFEREFEYGLHLRFFGQASEFGGF